jgi:hypothetical protein
MCSSHEHYTYTEPTADSRENTPPPALTWKERFNCAKKRIALLCISAVQAQVQVQVQILHALKQQQQP